MKCKCGMDMHISEWDGRKWYCPFCDKFGRKATRKEIERYEADEPIKEVSIKLKKDKNNMEKLRFTFIAEDQDNGELKLETLPREKLLLGG